MNDDDYWLGVMDRLTGRADYMTTRDIYSIMKDEGMAYSYNRGYYNDTRGDEVATMVLEAYAHGTDFDTLIQKNKQVRAYWAQIQGDKIAKAKAREKENARLAKLAEKRAEAAARKAEVMAKLTPEELAAFGLKMKGKK